MASSDLQKHLNRIEGQVRSISKMIDQERNCLDIIQQIIAVRASLTQVGLKLMESDLVNCDSALEAREKLGRLFKLI